jgi:hypothetical protein
MKQRTMALLLMAALALSLLGTAALAAEGDPAAPASSAIQTEPTESGGTSAGEPETPGEKPQGEESAEPADGNPAEDGEEPEAPVEEYIPDPVGSVTFGNLNRRMHEGNLQVLSIQESIDMLEEIDYDDLREDLRLQLNELAKTQWSLVMSSGAMIEAGLMSDYEYHSAYDQLDSAYDAVRKQFDAIKEGDMQADNADTIRQLKNLQNQIIMAGEATYIALAAMEIQEDGLERQLAALDRQLTELDLRYELGHVSSMAVKQAKSGRAALSSGLSTLGMNLNTYKGQLELLMGAEITGELSLGALPAVAPEELEAMDLEKDLETAKENSWDLYEATETYKDAREKYNDHGGDYGQTYKANDRSYTQARHTYYSAKYTYDNTVQSFELSLRNLYLKVKDYQQILAASQTALAVEQDNYTAAQLKQSQGTISQNALLEAGDKVAEAREKVAKAENDLFSAYNTYRWAVDYGIMN